MLGSLLCLPGSGSVLLDPCTGSTISETTSEAWSVEVLPSDSGQNCVVCVYSFSVNQRCIIESSTLSQIPQEIIVLMSSHSTALP